MQSNNRYLQHCEHDMYIKRLTQKIEKEREILQFIYNKFAYKVIKIIFTLVEISSL